uniref:F-box family protein n=1 Tax=Pithovirus LCPAC403 TaxID=2506596 RepID=A0A481ZDY2_9VIRU|nr:MAG: F-box family protein [Pithovirus LCPAC403]
MRLKKDISSTEIQEILLNLDINDISILCRTDKRFDNVCKRESFWRNKVLSPTKDMERYSENLGKEWVNGMTYKELIEEVYDRGPESLLYLHHLKMLEIDKALGHEARTSTSLFQALYT